MLGIYERRSLGEKTDKRLVIVLNSSETQPSLLLDYSFRQMLNRKGRLNTLAVATQQETAVEPWKYLRR